MPADQTDSNLIRPGYQQRSGARDDPRMDWWREAKFGLFIHWGLYAQDPGRWSEYPDTVTHHWTGEWIQHVKRIPRDQYVRWAETFDPRGFDADAWVRLAAQTGQKYIVITAKHHDGFCLFKTGTTDFNVVDASPFGRDIIAELAEACRRQSMPFGLYYSQAQDWHDPDGLGNDWDDDPQARDFQAYLDRTCKPQLVELLNNYGQIAVVWFDTPMSMTAEQSQQLVDLVHKHQPRCLVCGRIGNGLGDYTSYRDNKFASGPVDFDFETPMTMNRTWGYVEADKAFVPAPELLRKLIETASRGGNLLCNVGPDEMGLIPDGNRRPLLEAGRWLARNGESIYASGPAELTGDYSLLWTRREGKVYLHLLSWPITGQGDLPDAVAGVESVRLLWPTAQVPVRSESGRSMIRLDPAWRSALPLVMELSID